MRLFHGYENAEIGRPAVLTLGVFDGLHLGHQLIISRVVERARALGAVPTVLTFDPHPRAVLHPESAPPLLQTFDQKVEAFGVLGVVGLGPNPLFALTALVVAAFLLVVIAAVQLRWRWGRPAAVIALALVWLSFVARHLLARDAGATVSVVHRHGRACSITATSIRVTTSSISTMASASIAVPRS